VKHARATDRQRERAALFALGALPPDEAREFQEHLDYEGCTVCRSELEAFGGVAADLAFAAPPLAPRPEVRAWLLAAAREEAGPSQGAPPAFQFVLAEEGAWAEVEPGVFRKSLGGEPGSVSSAYLIRIEPGAHAATHRHDALEDCYVLRGDLHLAGRHLRAGDYHRAARGTVHDRIRTDGGCLLMIVETRA